MKPEEILKRKPMMKHRSSGLLRFLPVLVLFALSAAPGASVDSPMDELELEAMARKAKTRAEHVAVAKQYRLRAESFEAEAKKHEAEVQRILSRPASPLELKWPAMARKSWQLERQLAMQARRAAQEAYEKADWHLRRSIEIEADE